MGARPTGRFAAYTDTFKAISTRTGTPLSSLLVSFGILHEITAVVPLVGIFYGARTLGLGERVIDSVVENSPSSFDSRSNWPKETLRGWVEEGDRWAYKLGRRYGIFGFERRTLGPAEDVAESFQPSTHIAGDVANAVVAYGMTKALIPLRIGVSLYLSPLFSRRIVDPFRKSVMRLLRRKS